MQEVSLLLFYKYLSANLRVYETLSLKFTIEPGLLALMQF